jgi:hypothetical protein
MLYFNILLEINARRLEKLRKRVKKNTLPEICSLYIGDLISTLFSSLVVVAVAFFTSADLNISLMLAGIWLNK